MGVQPAPQVSASTWKIDPVHSVAEFKVRHLMISNVKGHFTSLSGVLHLDESDVTKSRVEASIDAASIHTREEQRDAHLKSADFLDAEKYPTISFKSRKIEADGEEAKVTGDLTIHGVTKEVVLKVEGPTAEGKDPWGNIRIGASASTKIKRSDFGLTWNAVLETGGIMVGDDLKIEVDVQMIKAAATTAA